MRWMSRLQRSRGTKDRVQFENRLHKSNKCTIIIVPSNSHNTTGKVSSEGVEGWDRGQAMDKKTNADLDVEPKTGRLQLRKADPPSGNKIWHMTGSTCRIMEGIQELSTVCKVACTIILGQSLIDRKSHVIRVS